MLDPILAPPRSIANILAQMQNEAKKFRGGDRAGRAIAPETRGHGGRRTGRMAARDKKRNKEVAQNRQGIVALITAKHPRALFMIAEDRLYVLPVAGP